MVNRFVMESHELFYLQSNQRVPPGLIIAELNLAHSGRPVFRNGSYLAANQTVLRQVLQQRNHGMQIEFRHKNIDNGLLAVWRRGLPR